MISFPPFFFSSTPCSDKDTTDTRMNLSPCGEKPGPEFPPSFIHREAPQNPPVHFTALFQWPNPLLRIIDLHPKSPNLRLLLKVLIKPLGLSPPNAAAANYVGKSSRMDAA